MGVGPGAIRAYHGSPHSFNKFDPSKIGTGEGAQAYGHGSRISRKASRWRGAIATACPRWLPPSMPGTSCRASRRNWRLSTISAPRRDGINLRSNILDQQLQEPAPDLEQQRAGVGHCRRRAGLSVRIKALESIDPAKLRSPGHMYEVDINADPQRLLDWDKPLRRTTDPRCKSSWVDSGVALCKPPHNTERG